MYNCIAQWRQRRGLTQAALARAAGISRPYLSDIERGVKEPSASIAQRLCTALGQPFEVLFPIPESAPTAHHGSPPPAKSKE